MMFWLQAGQGNLNSAINFALKYCLPLATPGLANSSGVFRAPRSVHVKAMQFRYWVRPRPKSPILNNQPTIGRAFPQPPNLPLACMPARRALEPQCHLLSAGVFAAVTASAWGLAGGGFGL